jgi:hypothetical protein
MRFYGEDENAVWNQIMICLIAYCLLLLMKLELKTNKTLLELNRLLKTNLTKPWEALQDAVFRRPTRTSKGRQKVAKV